MNNKTVIGPNIVELDDLLLLGKEQCPVCESKYILPVRYVYHLSKNEKFLLRYCMQCGSFWNSPAFLRQKEESIAGSSTNDVSHHLNVKDRNMKWAANLFSFLSKETEYSSVLEVGCGIGTALKVASDLGKKALGYDIRSDGIIAGRELYNIPLRDSVWKADTLEEKYDLVLCIHVLEHFMRPLPMIAELATYCSKHESLLFVSLPFISSSAWPQLLMADNTVENNIFRYCGGHYTYFSHEGLRKAFSLHGCQSRFVSIPDTGWSGFLFDFRKKSQSIFCDFTGTFS
jgi:2-polyprenyl-3-methyl-5-hydroxy-6-metoxy-1,4-benzoquinol methylase